MISDNLEPVTGLISYLVQDPRHDSEKPYYVYCDYDERFPRTNAAFEKKSLSIYNARSLDVEADQMLTDFGFARLPFDCPLSPDECYEGEKVVNILYPQFVDLLRSMFPHAVRFEFLEHSVRRRDPDYPSKTRERFSFPTNQPSDYAHIDMTPSSAPKNATKIFGIQPGHYKRFVALNLWKPIRGPVHDWPLTVCDRRTVDHTVHAVPMDIIASTFINENAPICYDDAHKWYYWPALQENEVIAFIQADSAAGYDAGVPHTAFKDPRVGPNVPPRESIEARVFIYFDE